MEYRDDGLMVDFGLPEFADSGKMQGRCRVVYETKQERELATLSQETKLMHAMNEIRAYSPKSMSRSERELFDIMCNKIFEKHGIKPETYRQEFGNLGTPQNLRR